MRGEAVARGGCAGGRLVAALAMARVASRTPEYGLRANPDDPGPRTITARRLSARPGPGWRPHRGFEGPEKRLALGPPSRRGSGCAPTRSCAPHTPAGRIEDVVTASGRPAYHPAVPMRSQDRVRDARGSPGDRCGGGPLGVL